MKAIAIAGIHTNTGKTIASAVMTQALACDYWKPVQAGGLDMTDSMTVRSLVSNDKSKFYDEKYVLREPMSPHAAANREKVNIGLDELQPVSSENLLLIETAGGLMSPVNSQYTVADYIEKYSLPVVLVAGAYLGSINHTLLCMEIIKSRNIDLKALIYCGERNMESESFIARYTGFEKVLYIGQINPLTKETVAKEASRIKSALEKTLFE